MNKADREMLIRVDERTKDLPDMKKKIDEIHGLKASVVWLTWGVRGLYASTIGALMAFVCQ